MKTVYIVTQGVYSDYHIEGAFSTEKKAQAFIDLANKTDIEYYDEYRIEEFKFDTVEAAWVTWVWLHEDGSLAEPPTMLMFHNGKEKIKHLLVRENKNLNHKYFGEVKTEDKDVAIKVMRDRIVAYKALKT